MLWLERWHSCGQRVWIGYEWNGLVNRVVFHDADGREIDECDCGECVSAWLEIVGDGTDRLVLRSDALLADPPTTEMQSKEIYSTQVLRTRDGRIVGNGIVLYARNVDELGMTFDVLTDFGNRMTLTQCELDRLFYVTDDVQDVVERAREQLVLLHDIAFPFGKPDGGMPR